MKTLKRITVFLLAAAFLISLSSCCGESGVVRKTAVTLNTISAPSDNRMVHFSVDNSAAAEPVAQSGIIRLFADIDSCSFSVQNVGANKLWSALPVYGDTPGNADDAAVVSLDILGGTDIYSLNSQDNSAAYGTADCIPVESGIKLVYGIFPDAATAAKKKLDTSDIAFSVTLLVTLSDGSLFVECSSENLSKNPDACITDMRLLNYFGAYTNSGSDDFLLVPDGCGAIIKTNVYDDSFEPLFFPVYGADPALAKDDFSGTAVVPAFGVKQGEAAFVCLITEGDAAAAIYADKATSADEYNRVYPGFHLTPYAFENEKLTAAPAQNNCRVKLCYRFISGANAGYPGMASACREQLIRDAVLSTRSVPESPYLPFNLALIGSAGEKAGPFEYTKVITDYGQALDLVTRLKNKGINSVNLRYIGMLTGGDRQEDIVNASPLRRLGSAEDYAGLYDYMNSQNMNLFPDVNILSASSVKGSGQVFSIYGKELKYSAKNGLYPLTGIESRTFRLRRVSQLGDTVRRLLTRARDYDFSGFCLNDIGSVLYSDFSAEGMSRTAALEQIKSSITPLSTNRTTMTVGGNFYTLKNTDVIVGLPMTSGVSESGAYRSVPFVQLILHGSADYSGSPLNLSGSVNEAMLRTIEYGACPYYEWSYGTEGSGTVFGSEEWINPAADFYSRANAVLSDLREARITDHSLVSDGVYATEYDNGAIIYVNYTEEDFTVVGTVVPAGDFTRIN